MVVELTVQEKLWQLLMDNPDFSVHEEWDEDYHPNGKFSAEVEWLPEGVEQRRFVEARNADSKAEAITELYKLRYEIPHVV